MEHLHERLDQEVEKPYYKGKVKIVRNKEREGLIRYSFVVDPDPYLCLRGLAQWIKHSFVSLAAWD